MGVNTIREVLHEAGYHFGMTRTWCPTARPCVCAKLARRRSKILKRRKKQVIELAYEHAEAAGIMQLCEDEAGPYQAIPQPGADWPLMRLGASTHQAE
ncbi:MAG: hypothetical protein H0U76_19105 [Ktedonobacteraceae bacterium]|nr:hypothetical protein [Ktedonobacteraceae bacterium]